MFSHKHTKPSLRVLLTAVALAAWSILGLSVAALADPPPHSHGGGGDGDGITNPAFVFIQPGKKGGGFSVDDLYLTTTDGSSTVRLTDTDSFRHNSTNWSPDGAKIAFQRQEDCGRLCLGPPQLYTIQPDGTGLTLVHDFGASGEPRPSAFGGEELFAWSPDGTQIVYAGVLGPSGRNDLFVLDVATGGVALLKENLQPIGEPAPLEQVGGPSFSPDLDPVTDGYQGKILFSGWDGVSPDSHLYILDVAIDGGTIQTGDVTVLNDDPLEQIGPAWSPDGQFIASREFAPEDLIKLMSVEASGTGLDVTVTVTGNQVLVTGADVDGHLCCEPQTWSPDSRWVGFVVDRTTSFGSTEDLFRIRPDGTDVTNVTNTVKVREFFPDWNPAWVNDIDP